MNKKTHVLLFANAMTQHGKGLRGKRLTDTPQFSSRTRARRHVQPSCPWVSAAEPVQSDPCNPSPCGPNAQCQDGTCTCLPEYQGDPYSGCRPECVLSTDCPRNRACIRNKCADPCPGTCGQGATCDVVNHIPICSCPQGTSGNPFVQCRPVPRT